MGLEGGQIFLQSPSASRFDFPSFLEEVKVTYVSTWHMSYIFAQFPFSQSFKGHRISTRVSQDRQLNRQNFKMFFTKMCYWSGYFFQEYLDR